mgnify:CR=1 FL=1
MSQADDTAIVLPVTVEQQGKPTPNLGSIYLGPRMTYVELEAKCEAQDIEMSRMRRLIYKLQWSDLASSDALQGTAEGKVKAAKLTSLQVMVEARRRLSIINAYQLREGRVPWMLIMLFIIAGAIGVAFFYDPKNMQQATVILSSTQNQIILVILALLVFGVVYMVTRRRRGRMAE